MARRRAKTRHVIGMMTGSSLDGLDAALVEIAGRSYRIRAKLLRYISRPLRGVSTSLRTAAEQRPITSERMATLALEFGKLHLDAYERLMGLGGARRAAERDDAHIQPDLIAVHGQTIFHQPPVSWQLLNPAPLAHAAQCPVVFDLRQADLAAGGEGAPITPIADWILFRDRRKRRAVVNLGGFCNVTFLPAGGTRTNAQIDEQLAEVRGFDICACNHVLDAIARDALGKPYDKDGRAARSGTVNARAAMALTNALREQHGLNRSLGTRDAALAWIDDEAGRMEPVDLAATAAAALGRFIGATLRNVSTGRAFDEILLAGGGTKHLPLRDAIRQHSDVAVHLSDELGTPVNMREAMAMAVLGALCADGVPITLPQVTGCSNPAPVAGTWIHPKK